MPASRGQLGALIALSLLVSDCSSIFGKDFETAKGKSDLTGPLIDAAAAAKAQNDLVTAVTYYRSALAREPNNTQAAIGLMQSLRMSGGLDEARGVAAKVLASKPADPAVLAEAGKVKLATGQLDDAIRLLRQATTADDKDATSLAALGLAYDRLGEFAQADGYYESALAISPRDAYVLNNYALSRVMANDLDDALKLLQRAASAPNADLRVRQNLALVYALRGDMITAEEQTRRDLPPALVGDAMQYYRQFAAALPRAPVAQAPLEPPKIDPLPVSHVAALATDNLVTATPRIEPAKAAPILSATLGPATDAHQAPAQLARLTPPAPARAQDDMAAPSDLPAARVMPTPHATRSIAERYTVQLGSYPSATSARHAASIFTAKGVTARLSRSIGRDGREWFVLHTTDFKLRDEAERVLRMVLSMGAVQPMVLRHRVFDAASEADATGVPGVEMLAVPSAQRVARPTVERFTVQLGSYFTEATARHAADTFTAKGVKVTVSRVSDRNGRAWFVVRTAEFERRQVADHTLRMLQSMGAVEPIVLRHRISDPAA